MRTPPLLRGRRAGPGPRRRLQPGDRRRTRRPGAGPLPRRRLRGRDAGSPAGDRDRRADDPLLALRGAGRRGPEDLHPVPGVAERWDVSPDGRVYTFRLRDARWSDGRPVTARDFVESWRRILTPSLGAENASFLYILQGAEAFNRGLTGTFRQVGVEADGRRARCGSPSSTPTPDFLARLTHWAWCPVPVAVIAAHGPRHGAGGNPWAEAGHLVGNGPFVLRRLEARPGDRRRKVPDLLGRGPGPAAGDPLPADRQRRRRGAGLPRRPAPPDRRPARRKIDAYRRDAPQLLRIDPLPRHLLLPDQRPASASWATPGSAGRSPWRSTEGRSSSGS